MDHHHKLYKVLFLFSIILLSQLQQSHGGWFFSSEKTTKTHQNNYPLDNFPPAEFALAPLKDNDDEKSVQEVKNFIEGPDSCWKSAYANLRAGCSRILSEQNLKDRLAWDLTDCFQKHTGRSLPYCDPKGPVKSCLKKLDDNGHKVFLVYFTKIDSYCHQFQLHAFKHQTERLVNELKTSADYAEEKLINIDERGKKLLQNSENIHDSLSSIDLQTQQVAETSRDVQENVNVIKRYSEDLHEQSKGIAASQEELISGQLRMKEKVDEGIAMVTDSYNDLGREILNLKDETVAIEKEVGRVGEMMSTKMDSLQSKADGIEETTTSSLGKQKELLASQSAALEGLNILTAFQSQALEHSRGTLQQLSELGKRQQEELLNRQQELTRVHNQLSENSKIILAAQEAFESKQARMLTSLDKLFVLHNALLIESRSIKIFIIYSLLIFVLYMFTSMKQTYNVRPRLYLGLCVAFLIEISTLRCTTCSLEHQTWIVSSTRSLFLVLASLQLLYAIYTYRDYEMLNHQILLSLIDKINGIQRKNKALEWEMDEDSEVNWSSWIDTELPEDVSLLDDPDYNLAEQMGESSDESSSVVTRYNLRNRLKKIKI